MLISYFGGRCFQILWPSQNIWTLQNWCRKMVSLKSQKHKNVDAIFKIQKGSGSIIWSQENRRHINQKWLLCWFLLKNMTHTFYIIELQEDQIYQIELNWIFGKNQTQKRSRPLISWPISDSAINSNSLFSSNFILAVTLAPKRV